MIPCELATKNFELDEKTKEYAFDKLGGLEKYLPKHMRSATNVAILLEADPSGREDNRFVCDAVVIVGGTTLVSREGTVNMFASIDIVEAKLKVQVLKLKEKSTFRSRRTRMIGRLLGRRRTRDGESAEQNLI